MEGNDNIEDINPEDAPLPDLLVEDPAAPLEDIIITNTIPDPELLQHPIFQSIDDPFLSIVLQPLKSFISADPDSQLKYQEIIGQFKTSMHQNIFGSREIQDLHDQFEQLGLLAKQVCGKILVKGDIYFRCLDCDEHSNPALISILCSSCFENSNHDGHRIMVIKKDSNSSAACDCGDANEMNPAGFCPNHQNKQIDIEALLKLFPATIFQATQNTLKKAIYSIISLYELKQKTAHHSIEQLIKLLADLLIEELLRFCQTCYTQISGSFLFIFLKILQGQFLPTMNKVWHDCEDFTNEFSYNEIAAEKSFSCTCTLLGNLFKIGKSIPLEAQVMLQKILVESSTELKFKEFIMLEFTKYLHYLYSQDYTNDEDDEAINSRLLNMQIQLYGREEFLHKVIDAGYHQNFIEVIRRAVHGTLEVNYELYYILSDIRSALSYFTNLKYSTAKRLVTQTDFMKDLFEILMNFQIKFAYPGAIHIGLYEHLVDYRSLNRGLMIEKVICLILESGLRVLNKNLPVDQKLTYTKSIISEWYVNFSLARDIIAEDRRNGSVSFHIGLERIFCAILRGSLPEENFTKSASEGFLKQNLPDVDSQNLAEMILEGNFRTMGLIRYLTLVHNYNAGELWYVYYFFNNSLFEIDIVTAQLLTMLMKPENLFQDVVQSFFSYSPELVDFFVHPSNLKTQEDYLKQKLAVLQDFLQYLIFLMNDEICLLNLDIKDRITAFEPFPNDSRYKRVVEKVCINLLLGHYWTDLSSVKGDLEGVLRDQQQIDDIVMKITVLDEKTHKIRVKDEYQSELDPYIFYRKPSLQQEILNNVPNKSKNQDLISGQYYKNLPQYLKTIQQNLYQSSLPDFLTLFLDNYNELTSSLVRPVLKLILMNLQVAQEYHHLENLLQIVNKNYLTPKFTETLKGLLGDSDLKDCRPCIVKIQGIISSLSAQTQQLSATSMLVESAEDAKKRLAREKMEKLKAQFSQKQALFADVNKKLLLEESPDLEETQIDVLTCQYCLEKIDKASEKYGIPIFVTFTNNLFDVQNQTTPFKEIDYNGLDQASWWPIISSCNHDYHQKCFEKHFTNTRTPGDTASRYFNDQFETYCSLCKTLCNHFLCINDDQSQTFSQKTVDILSEMVKRLASILPPSQDPIELEPYQVTPQGIFQRAYAHFLETFHLHNQPKIFEKNFNLYKHFFHAFQSPSLNENYSLLADIQRTLKKSSQDPLQYDPQTLINHIMSQGITHTQILKDYLAFRITQAIGFHAPNNLLTIKHCLPYYQGNKSLQENLTSDLIFPLQKITLAYFLNTSDHQLSTAQLADLICSPFQPPEDYLNRLLQTCGISTPLNKLIEDIFTEDLPNQEKVLLDLLNSMLLPKTISLNTQRPTLTTKMAPRVLHLPDNYMEFNNTLYRQKCGICHEYSRDLLTVVCLICGDMLCQVSCDKTKILTGNLNRHAAKYHMGMGLFLDLVELNKSLVNAPLNTINTMKETYIDNFGQPVQDILNAHNELSKLDFKQFGLNKEFVDEVEELIKNNSVAKELFRISLKASHYYEAGYL